MNKTVQSYLTKFAGKRLNLLYNFAPQKAVVKVEELFTHPIRYGKSKKQKEFLSTASRTEELLVDGLNIQTYCWKKGKEFVLLAHGWQSNAARWEATIKWLLKNNLSVVALDAPAQGDSEGRFYNQNIYGKAIRQLIKKHRVKYAVGHSLGGFTLMLEQYKKPFNCIEKLIVMGAPVDFKFVRNDFKDKLGLKEELMNDFDRHFAQKYQYNLASFTMMDYHKGFSIPTLFIHDKTDKVVPYQPTKALAELWGNAQIKLTNELGHSLKSVTINQFITTFILEN